METIGNPGAIPRPRGRSRRRRWILLGLLAAFLAAPGVVYLYYRVAADLALRQAVEEADRLDPGWRLEELEAKRPTIPDEDNAALLLLRASAKLPWPWRTGSALHERLDKVPPPLRLSDPDAAALRAALGPQATALEEARKLAGMPRGRHPVFWSADGISTGLSHLDETNKLLSWLQADILLRAQAGDAEDAWVSALAVLNAARAMRDEPCATSQLAHAAWRAKGVAALERILARGQVSDRTLEQTQRVLEEDAEQPLLLAALRGERALCDRMMTALEKGDTDLSKLLPWMSSFGNTSEFRLAQHLPRSGTTLMIKESHACLLRHLTAAVEAGKLPPGERERKLVDLGSARAEAPPLAAVFMQVNRGFPAAFQRSQGVLRCAAVGLAAERYRLKNGRWPEGLETLVQAGLLKAVPTDPFSGGPLGFRKAPDGIVVYSVGENSRQDGTALDDLTKYPQAERVEFRLWNPDQRGRLPFVAAP